MDQVTDLDQISVTLSRVPQDLDPQHAPVRVQLLDKRSGQPIATLRPSEAAALGEVLGIRAMDAFRAGQRG